MRLEPLLSGRTVLLVAPGAVDAHGAAGRGGAVRQFEQHVGHGRVDVVEVRLARVVDVAGGVLDRQRAVEVEDVGVEQLGVVLGRRLELGLGVDAGQHLVHDALVVGVQVAPLHEALVHVADDLLGDRALALGVTLEAHLQGGAPEVPDVEAVAPPVRHPRPLADVLVAQVGGVDDDLTPLPQQAHGHGAQRVGDQVLLDAGEHAAVAARVEHVAHRVAAQHDDAELVLQHLCVGGLAAARQPAEDGEQTGLGHVDLLVHVDQHTAHLGLCQGVGRRRALPVMR